MSSWERPRGRPREKGHVDILVRKATRTSSFPKKLQNFNKTLSKLPKLIWMDHGSIHLMPSTYAQHAILMPYWACAVLMPSMQYLCLVLPSISRAIGHFSSFCNSKHTLDKNDQTNSLSSASFAPSGLPSKISSASDTPWVNFFQTTPAAFPQSVPNLAGLPSYL